MFFHEMGPSHPSYKSPNCQGSKEKIHPCRGHRAAFSLSLPRERDKAGTWGPAETDTRRHTYTDAQSPWGLVN